MLIETDLGHDPDDLFAICYLQATREQAIDTITITPGDPDQIAICELIRQRVGGVYEIGASKMDREKLSSGSVHHDLLKKYRFPFFSQAAGYGGDLILQDEPTEVFSCGPMSNIRRYLELCQGKHTIEKMTVQGGFCPYSLYWPTDLWLEKFHGKEYVPTFNFNGDKEAAKQAAGLELVGGNPIHFVGKNVCHAFEVNNFELPSFKPKCAASDLFVEALGLFFSRHNRKKFHDPLAAVLHRHPDLGTWIDGQPVYEKGKWSTIPGPHKVCVNIDMNGVRDCLYQFQ